MADSLYVCHFSNGHIKVGRSIDPQSRIASHADRVACLGVELVEHHIVECVGPSEPRESVLIGLCADIAAIRNCNEWFVGLDYEDVCKWATDCATRQHEESTSVIKSIRQRLGLTQAAFAAAIGCTQGNIGHYERGQTISPAAARRLIDFAASRGLVVTFDEIYSDQLAQSPECR